MMCTQNGRRHLSAFLMFPTIPPDYLLHGGDGSIFFSIQIFKEEICDLLVTVCIFNERGPGRKM